MIHARRQHPAFGLGSFTDLGGSNPTRAVLRPRARRRRRRHDVIVCVNNLSRFPQPVELDLRRWEGMRPVELLGGVPFPRDRRAAVSPDPGWVRLLLVPADRARHRGGTAVVTEHHATSLDAVRRVHRARALVRRQGPRRSRSPTSAASARCPAGDGGRRCVIDLVERRPTPTAGDGRALPGAAGVLHRARRTGSTTPSSAGGRTSRPRLAATPTTRVHDREAMALLAARLRPTPAATGDAARSTGSRATSSTWTRTRRCSAASSPTPRWRSARTRC